MSDDAADMIDSRSDKLKELAESDLPAAEIADALLSLTGGE